MNRLYDWLEGKLSRRTPEQLRRASIKVLVWSVVGMVINVGLYLFGVITESHLILVTLILSWLAPVIEAANGAATQNSESETG